MKRESKNDLDLYKLGITRIRKLKPGQSISVMEAWNRICNPFRKKDLMILEALERYENKEQEVDFKRVSKYRSLFDPEIIEKTYCKLYEPEEKECKNPQRKCKNCSVYHGFKGSGRL